MRNYGDLRRETFDVLCFLLQKALRYEQREVRVAGAGLLDSTIELVAQVFPDGEAVGAKNNTSTHRRIVGEFGANNQVVVPASKILAARREFLFIDLVGHKRILSGIK